MMHIDMESSVSWRVFQPTDLLFAYELAVVHGPRWWNVTRHGMSPTATSQALATYAAGVTIVLGDDPIGLATLRETGTAGTGIIEILALDTPDCRGAVEQIVPELISSVFAISNVRTLYHQRFDNDFELRGRTLSLWRDEVHFPEYALIDGVYEGMTQSALRRTDFEQSHVHSESIAS